MLLADPLVTENEEVVFNAGRLDRSIFMRRQRLHPHCRAAADKHLTATVNLTLLKLVVTPALIGLASLAGRKWGHAISGWIVALPLTTGPIVFFLALSHGPAFAADTTAGILTGCFSLVAFTMVYARLALRWRWLPTLVVSSLVFFVMTALLQSVRMPLLPLWIGVLAALLVAFRLLPHAERPRRLPRSSPVSGTFPCAWRSPLVLSW